MSVRTLLKDIFFSTDEEITEEALPGELNQSFKSINEIEKNHLNRIEKATTAKKEKAPVTKVVEKNETHKIIKQNTRKDIEEDLER